MNVCVAGLWHLGTVTAACLASAGHDVVGFDDQTSTIEALACGTPPVFEPGLEALIGDNLAAGRLRFANNAADAVGHAEVVWITYDTPVDDDDRADVESVLDRVRALLPLLREGTCVVISSQLPIGSTARLEREHSMTCSDRPIGFAYVPENLRLGSAIDVFMHPDRVVVGVRSTLDRDVVQRLLAPITDRVEWMSVESAEMTKHAINGFLATSVTFINEVATLCESVGADAGEVERGLKSERRIGPQAYLGPGGAFAGGTLARDVAFLASTGAEHGLPMHLLRAVRSSNDRHKEWPRNRLQSVLGDGIRGATIAVWGLTYKGGTNTLRRSSSVELCTWLHEQGATVQAYDPQVVTLPEELASVIALHKTPLGATRGASALVVMTNAREFTLVTSDAIIAAMSVPIIIDSNAVVSRTLATDPRVRYFSVGRGQ